MFALPPKDQAKQGAILVLGLFFVVRIILRLSLPNNGSSLHGGSLGAG